MAYLSLKNVTKEYHSGEVTIRALSGVELEIEKGRVDIVIGAEGDEPIYFGNDVDSGKSELPVSAAGQYKVTVEARGAAGEIAVQRLPNAAEE